MWREYFNNSELEFLAENVLIDIIPFFKQESIELCSGTYGPFKPNKKVQVPLWVALQYKNKNNCKISIPPFLELNFLTDALDTEKKDKSKLFPLPENFFEIAQILFTNADDDFLDIKTTRGLVEDIIAIRNEKIYNLLSQIQLNDVHFKFENFTQKEIEQIRPLLSEIFNHKIELASSKKNNSIKDSLFTKPIFDEENEENKEENNEENKEENNEENKEENKEENDDQINNI